MLRMRIVVRRPSGRCHIEGAERNWEVRRVTFSGFDKRVSRVVAEPRSLNVVRHGRLEKVSVVCYIETSCSSDLLCRARSRVANDLSVYMFGTSPGSELELPTHSDQSLRMRDVWELI